jgi:hypothetical protein
VKVGPGASTSEAWDLRYIYNLTPGKYNLVAEQYVYIGQDLRLLSASATLTIPSGFVTNSGCTAEAKAHREPNRKLATLSDIGEFGKSPEIDGALSRVFKQADGWTERPLIAAMAESTIGAGIPGGLAIRSHGVPELVCLEDAKTVKDAMEAIRMTRPELLFDWRSNIVNLIDSRVSDFLETKIGRIEIPHPATELDDAIEAVFAAPEMRVRADFLGIDDQTPRTLGPHGHPATRDKEFQSERPLVLETATAREVLNAVVQRWGSGIWVYSEWTLGGKLHFRLVPNLGPHIFNPGMQTTTAPKN